MNFSESLISRTLMGAVVITMLAGTASARIGDTKEEADARFKAVDTTYLKDKHGLEYATYSMPGFSIKQYYRDGTCVKSIYYKKYVEGGSREFIMPEIQKLAEVEASGAWKVVKAPGSDYDPSSSVYAKFENAEGTTLAVSSNKRMITVETQSYREVAGKM